MSGKPKRFLRLHHVEDRSGLRHTQIHYLETRGLFPRRIKLSTRAAGWVESEIDEWIESRIAASRRESASPADSGPVVARLAKKRKRVHDTAPAGVIP